jgi:hypothetical protein
METRRDLCRGCRALVDDVGDLGTCLICSLKASLAVCRPEPPRSRRIQQPMSLEAKLRQSNRLFHAPIGEEPFL